MWDIYTDMTEISTIYNQSASVKMRPPFGIYYELSMICFNKTTVVVIILCLLSGVYVNVFAPVILSCLA